MESRRRLARVWLSSYKGGGGKCARLEQLAKLAANGYHDWRPEHGGGGSAISDPTFSEAAYQIHASARVREEYEALERDIGFVLALLAQCPHGDAMGDYYVTADEVFWWQVADWYGVSEKTLGRWRDDALDWLADHAAL
jgi:hypothetical protein